MNDKPNYYAIIPANVRYSKNIVANEKLLYGEITSLSSKNGYCNASNEYFANLFHVGKSTISRWIGNLQKENFINVSYKKRGAEVLTRYIKITNDGSEKGSQNNQSSNDGKRNRTNDEKRKENNTSTNNKKESNTKVLLKKERFELFWVLYPRKEAKAKTINWFEKNSIDDDLFKIILEKLDQFKKTKQWQDRQYIPLPPTWLNEKRWEDELPEIETEAEQLARLKKELEEENGFKTS